MMILRIPAPGQPVWEAAPLPVPGPGQVRLRVLAVTTCPHWDLHVMAGEQMFPGRPLEYPYTPGQPGHEATGVVDALGPGVQEFSVGQRVSLWRDQGPQRQGFYARYGVADVDNLLAVPSTLSPQASASLELAMCVQASFDQIGEQVQGARCGITGLGPAGLLAIQMAKAWGASEVVGFDPVATRRQAGAALGADRVLPPTPDAFPHDRFSEGALGVAIDCTGLPAAVSFLMDRTRDVLSLFGVLRENVPFGFHHWRRGLTLIGGPRHTREAAQRALGLINAGRLSLEPLVSVTLPFSQYAHGVDLLRRKKAVKVCFDPWA